MSEKSFRLLTRSGFDGIVCALLLREIGIIDEVIFIHPKDLLEGNIAVDGNCIIANLPYADGAHLVFDHHVSEIGRFEHSSDRWTRRRVNHVIDANAPSAAQVIYQYYGGSRSFPNISSEILQAVDQADSRKLNRADILAPRDWMLLNFILDPRTGLGRFQKFQTSNDKFMLSIIEYCRKYSIGEILVLPDVRERIEHYWNEQHDFIEQLERCVHIEGKVVIADLRDQKPIFAGNRFMIYALYPDAAVSIHLVKGHNDKGQNDEITALTVGRSIINNKSSVDIGSIMLEFGGGGHKSAGGCQVSNDKAVIILDKLVRLINRKD